MPIEFLRKKKLILGFARLLAVRCAKRGMNVLATCRTAQVSVESSILYPLLQGLRSLGAVTINGKGTVSGYFMDPANEASVLEMKLRIQDEVITKGKGTLLQGLSSPNFLFRLVCYCKLSRAINCRL
jgi:hypothetical protein